MKDYIAYLRFDDMSEDALFKCFVSDIEKKSKKIIVTPNLDGLRLTYHDKSLRRLINRADYCTIDGKPILGFARKEGKKNFKYKISGSDMVADFLPIANQNSYSMVIFGGKEGVGEKAKEKISAKYPNIRVIKTICPEFGFENEDEKCKQYAIEISSFNADIILLCVGFPKAENFYFKNQSLFSHGLFFCVGATVDFLAGNIKRAPKWVSNIGCEWLFRLCKDFRHLFKRYFLDLMFFLKLSFLYLFCPSKITSRRDDLSND
jgi:N-acetylglucosaminyldiphosphoundecaprenol N-acetyl-beta-D-mannosaminyltransferase